MKEPDISIGIVNAQKIHFSLNGQFSAKGETVCGNQVVSFSEGGILWNNTLYKEAESQFLSVLKEHLDKNYEKWKKDSKQAEG